MLPQVIVALNSVGAITLAVSAIVVAVSAAFVAVNVILRVIRGKYVGRRF